MRSGLVGLMLLGLALGPAAAQAPSPSVPTPATPGPNPGAAATDAITSPTRPTQIDTAPGTPSATPGGRAPAPGTLVAPPPPNATGPRPAGEMGELLDQARAIARSTRESVEYGRVVPDILTQILAKLDKIEDKLDKVENAVKAGNRPRR